MLRIYTRHDRDCVHKGDLYHRRCRCPKWVRGVLPNRRSVRESARTRSWEHAERYAQGLEEQSRPANDQQSQTKTMEPATALSPPEQTPGDSATDRKNPSVTIEEAVKLFLADHAAQGNSDDTTRKYRGLLQKVFANWAGDEGFRYLSALAPVHLTKFRSTWH